jgi:hypothetical protein
LFRISDFSLERDCVSKDITPILEGWEHAPDQLQVRIITGDDGRDKIQMRLDLGLIQMELDGRPDGQRPGGFKSFLDALENQGKQAAARGESLALDSDQCATLMREGVQYYHRYLAAFHLQRHDLVVRDTERNLRLFAFVVAHATHQRDKLQFDQYRPYVVMMNTRAHVALALALADHAAALDQVDAGIERIRAFLSEYGKSEHEVQCPELATLLGLRTEVEAERPVGPLEGLKQQLALAISLEDYEEAARIRDQLQRLRNAGIPDRG